jgi:hypothetical protein
MACTKCDYTSGVDTKQLDDGIDHTFISAGASETICPSFLFNFVPLDVCYVVADPALRTDTKVQWTCTYGVAHPYLVS